MGVFNDDIVTLPEINADIIRGAADFKINNHHTHEELMEIINNIVHSIYYNAKVGVYPEKGEWMYEGRLFGISQAYATGPNMTVPPPSWQKIIDEAQDTIDYIEKIFTQLGFEFEYIKVGKYSNLINCVIIRIPFKPRGFESFAQRVYSQIISANLVSVQSLDTPDAKLTFTDLNRINTALEARESMRSMCNYGSI